MEDHSLGCVALDPAGLAQGLVATGKVGDGPDVDECKLHFRADRYSLEALKFAHSQVSPYF
jgi:hypothetical protein